MRHTLSLLIALALAADTFASPLFGDRVVAKGKGFEIKSSQVEETFILFKANRVDNLEGLKTSVGNQLKARKESQNRVEQRRQVSEAIGAKVEFSVPDSLVENETQSVLRNFIEEQMRRGVPQAVLADRFSRRRRRARRRSGSDGRHPCGSAGRW